MPLIKNLFDCPTLAHLSADVQLSAFVYTSRLLCESWNTLSEGLAAIRVHITSGPKVTFISVEIGRGVLAVCFEWAGAFSHGTHSHPRAAADRHVDVCSSPDGSMECHQNLLAPFFQLLPTLQSDALITRIIYHQVALMWP